jgi:hypothetical protein
MADPDGEATETQVWIDFAHECGYLPETDNWNYAKVMKRLGGC